MNKIGQVAVTCVADPRLRGLCAILLRHAGYRILEADSVDAAKTIVQSTDVAMLVAGELADPAEQLTEFADTRNLRYVRLGPDVQIEALLRMFETINETSQD